MSRQIAQGLCGGVEPELLHLAGPGEALAASAGPRPATLAVVGQAEVPERHLEIAALGVVRVEVDRDQDDVVTRPRVILP